MSLVGVGVGVGVGVIRVFEVFSILMCDFDLSSFDGCSKLALGRAARCLYKL